LAAGYRATTSVTVARGERVRVLTESAASRRATRSALEPPAGRPCRLQSAWSSRRFIPARSIPAHAPPAPREITTAWTSLPLRRLGCGSRPRPFELAGGATRRDELPPVSHCCWAGRRPRWRFFGRAFPPIGSVVGIEMSTRRAVVGGGGWSRGGSSGGGPRGACS